MELIKPLVMDIEEATVMVTTVQAATRFDGRRFMISSWNVLLLPSTCDVSYVYF